MYHYLIQETNCEKYVTQKHQRLGVLLLQEKDYNEWELNSCASKNLTDYHSKISTNELELLASVWAAECWSTLKQQGSEIALQSNYVSERQWSRLTR